MSVCLLPFIPIILSNFSSNRFKMFVVRVTHFPIKYPKINIISILGCLGEPPPILKRTGLFTFCFYTGWNYGESIRQPPIQPTADSLVVFDYNVHSCTLSHARTNAHTTTVSTIHAWVLISVGLIDGTGVDLKIRSFVIKIKMIYRLIETS